MASFTDLLNDDSLNAMRPEEAANIISALYSQDDASWHRYNDIVDLTLAFNKVTVATDSSMSRPEKRSRARTCGEAQLPDHDEAFCSHDLNDSASVHASKMSAPVRFRSSSAMDVSLAVDVSSEDACQVEPIAPASTVNVMLTDQCTPEPEDCSLMEPVGSNRSTPTRQLAFDSYSLADIK
eukprot:TRINITY_DN168_c0_g1_i1.p2 TRINITY_DN168_c0_g1~~TRINITY_DN168_c0_g1_i1.p2  ORF type:complete len:181 (+),score=23.20 TRINITY_DN168_c0_g1_i1:765-1307(+)